MTKSQTFCVQRGMATQCPWTGMRWQVLWFEFFIHWPGTHPADELVESIKKAMGDKEMAANLERIHNLYLDREEKPVEKVEKLSCKKDYEYAGCLVGGVCV